MAAGILVGGAVGVATLYVWGWRRFKYMRAYWRHNKQTIEFERRLREARDEASAERTYRAATAADDEVAMLDMAKADEAELVACGFTVLGDIAVSTPDRPRLAYLRTFVDRSQTTSATLALFCNDPRKTFLWFDSYRGDESFVTMRGPQTRFAEPPTMHRQAVAKDLAVAKLDAQHRSFVGDATTCLRLGTLDELLAQVRTFHTSVVRWRAAQEPDVLLDADLRGVLGEQYGKLGNIWARRLRSRLPAATLRRS